MYSPLLELLNKIIRPIVLYIYLFLQFFFLCDWVCMHIYSLCIYIYIYLFKKMSISTTYAYKLLLLIFGSHNSNTQDDINHNFLYARHIYDRDYFINFTDIFYIFLLLVTYIFNTIYKQKHIYFDDSSSIISLYKLTWQTFIIKIYIYI